MPALVFLARSAGFVRNQQYICAQKGTLLIEFEHFEALAALGDQVHAPVGILLRDRNDLGGTPNFGNALFQGADHAERRIICQTLANHLFVSWLENVQGQGSARKQNDVKREQGKKGHEVSNLRKLANRSGFFDCTA